MSRIAAPTPDQLHAAILKGGYITRAAPLLNIHVRTLERQIARDPLLRAAANEAMRENYETRRDLACGTRYGYVHYGCRCGDCTRANTEDTRPRMRAHYERKRQAKLEKEDR